MKVLSSLWSVLRIVGYVLIAAFFAGFVGLCLVFALRDDPTQELAYIKSHRNLRICVPHVDSAEPPRFNLQVGIKNYGGDPFLPDGDVDCTMFDHPARFDMNGWTLIVTPANAVAELAPYIEVRFVALTGSGDLVRGSKIVKKEGGQEFFTAVLVFLDEGETDVIPVRDIPPDRTNDFL